MFAQHESPTNLLRQRAVELKARTPRPVGLKTICFEPFECIRMPYSPRKDPTQLNKIEATMSLCQEQLVSMGFDGSHAIFSNLHGLSLHKLFCLMQGQRCRARLGVLQCRSSSQTKIALQVLIDD